jgi:drug/metabolite transporter (DMT)-like permease
MKKLAVSGGMLVFLGAVFWSLNAPIVKFLTADPFLICGLRSLIAGIALAVFIRPQQLRWNGWMALYLLSYCALCVCIILALSMTSSAIAIGMQYTALIWLFFAQLLQTRRFDFARFIPVAVILAGVVLFMCSGTDATSAAGNLIALAEGVIFACMTVSAKKAAGSNPLGLTAVSNLFTGAVVLLAFPASTVQIASLSGNEWVWMLILGVVQIGCGYAFYNMGVQRVTPQKASILALWEMVLGPVWVALFLQEYPSVTVIVGLVVVLAGMVMDALQSK